MVRYFINVFFSLFALVGLAALLYSLWSVYMGHQAKTWPHTTGTVLRAYCYSTAGNKSWIRHVLYKYQVGGTSYKSDREQFGIQAGSKDCVAGYTRGQVVNVLYNPADHGDAVLKPGATSSAEFGIIFGLVFMILSGIGYWLAAKHDGRKKS